MKRFLLIAGMVAAFGLGSAAAYAATSDKPPAPPGQGECEHGNSQKPCKDDPQPTHGKDCENHGNSGGVNEDHCATTTTETTTTTTSGTTPGTTTPQETTTPQGTTPTDSTPGGTPPDQTPSGETPPASSSSGPASTAAPVAASGPAAPEAPAAPDVQQAPQSLHEAATARVSAAQHSKVAGATASAPPASAPTTAPQAPPFTP
jgi:hypothetical protein